MNCNVSSSELNLTILRFSTASFLVLCSLFGIAFVELLLNSTNYLAHLLRFVN